MADFPSSQIDEPSPESGTRLLWDRKGQLTELPATDPGLDPNTYRYFMRAYRALTPGFVQWDNLGWADFTGEKSGYTPTELSDIILLGSSLEITFEPVLLALNGEVTAIDSPKTILGDEFIPPWSTVIKFRVTFYVSNGATVGTVKLYNSTNSEFVTSAELSTSSTTPVTLSATVTVGYGANEMPPSQKTYDLRLENDGSLISDITYLGSVYLDTE